MAGARLTWGARRKGFLTVDAICRLLAAVVRWFFSFFVRFASDLVVEALAPVKNPRDPRGIEIVGKPPSQDPLHVFRPTGPTGFALI